MRELRAALKTLAGQEMRSSSRQMPAAKVSTRQDPDWLERSGSFTHASEQVAQTAAAQPTGLAAMLMKDATRVLARINATTDPIAFRAIVGQLDAAIRSLAELRETASLWKLTSTLDVIATEPAQGTDSRAALAASLVRIAYDPQVLAPIAEHVLAAEGPTEFGWKIIVRAGLGGAYALYSARVKNQAIDARQRFVMLLTEIGIPALPVMRAALERVEPRLATPGASALAEDLLSALPAVADEATGNVVARYARNETPEIACAATRALPRLWGKRAGPLLVALLAHPDDDVRLAALEGLVALHAIDTHVVRKIECIVDGTAPGSRQLREAAIAALTRVDGEAQPAAAAVLARSLGR
jgi:serine/threonine-protein kinase